MSRKKDFPVLISVFQPPPEIPKKEARKRMARNLSAKQMRNIRPLVENLDQADEYLAQKLGPENFAHADGRKWFEAKVARNS